MQFNEFCAQVCDEIGAVLKRYGIDVNTVDVQKVMKNNGVSLTALMITQAERNIVPTIYMEPFYEKYSNGMLYSDVMEEIAKLYSSSLPDQDFNVSSIADFDKIKGRIIYSLINYEKNVEFLKTVPHERIEDLAIIYKILMPQGEPYGDMATITIHNNLFSLYDVSVEELHEIAADNMKGILPGNIQHISEILGDFALPWPEEPTMYIVSNVKQTFGAGSILEPEIMDALSEKLGNTYYVIPSSVHEVIVVPDTEEYSPDFFANMISEVNESQLEDVEVLGTKPYVVDAVEHKLILAEKREEYFKEKELQKQKQQKLQEEEKIQEPNGPKL
ncbi:MAG: DUF5688 family protein [Agathobacter sp.]